jgi:hypothetical protein
MSVVASSRFPCFWSSLLFLWRMNTECTNAYYEQTLRSLCTELEMPACFDESHPAFSISKICIEALILKGLQCCPGLTVWTCSQFQPPPQHGCCCLVCEAASLFMSMCQFVLLLWLSAVQLVRRDMRGWDEVRVTLTIITKKWHVENISDMAQAETGLHGYSMTGRKSNVIFKQSSKHE